MSKTNDMIELLKKNALTIDEIVVQTGLSKNTAQLQLNYHLPKKGVKIIKTDKNGVIAYKIGE